MEDDDKADEEVVQPDPVEGARNNPGKEVIESGTGGPIIMNHDVKNAARIAFLQGITSRVEQLSEELQNEVGREDQRPVGVPLDEVGAKLFELHTLTISYVESVGEIFCQWSLKVNSNHSEEILNFFREESDKHDIDFSSRMTRQEEVEAIQNELPELTAYHYIEIFHFTNQIDSVVNSNLHEARMTRNDFIHDPISLISVEDPDEVLSMIINCLHGTQAIKQMLDRDLPINDGMYDTLTSK